jgi:exosortase E/protease (VPEID-CTERM system)
MLALGVLIVVNRAPFLHRHTPVRVRLGQDEVAARIVPFVVFMLSGVAAKAFWGAPVFAYPWQAAALGLALWWFRVPLGAMIAWPSTLSLLIGGTIGLAWIVTAQADGSGFEALAWMSQLGLAIWIATRLIGTVALVPVIEELFFRGYVQDRLDRGGWHGVCYPSRSLPRFSGCCMRGGSWPLWRGWRFRWCMCIAGG